MDCIRFRRNSCFFFLFFLPFFLVIRSKNYIIPTVPRSYFVLKFSRKSLLAFSPVEKLIRGWLSSHRLGTHVSKIWSKHFCLSFLLFLKLLFWCSLIVTKKWLIFVHLVQAPGFSVFPVKPLVSFDYEMLSQWLDPSVF